MGCILCPFFLVPVSLFLSVYSSRCLPILLFVRTLINSISQSQSFDLDNIVLCSSHFEYYVYLTHVLHKLLVVVQIIYFILSPVFQLCLCLDANFKTKTSTAANFL